MSQQEIPKQKLENLDEISAANVEITFNPPWEPSMMNNEARKKLGFDEQKPQKETSKEIDTDWE